VVCADVFWVPRLESDPALLDALCHGGIFSVLRREVAKYSVKLAIVAQYQLTSAERLNSQLAEEFLRLRDSKIIVDASLASHNKSAQCCRDTGATLCTLYMALNCASV
jgi:hypothetical protein